MDTFSSVASSSGKSDRDVTDFVKYLLDGSGAESIVDYPLLRKDLEASVNSTQLLDGNSLPSKYIVELLDAVDSSVQSISPVVQRSQANRSAQMVSLDKSTPRPQEASHNTNNTNNVDLDIPKEFYRESLENISPFSDKSNIEQTKPNTKRIAILNDISQRLTSLGFPPLPTTILQTSSTLTDRQIDALNSTFDTILKQHSNQIKLSQNLVEQTNKQSEEIINLKVKLQSIESNSLKNYKQDSNLLLSMQKSSESRGDEVAGLRIELATVKKELEGARGRAERAEREVVGWEERVGELDVELQSVLLANEKKAKRIENAFAEVTGLYHRNPAKSGLDRLTLEVISVYEDKLEKLEAKLEKSGTGNGNDFGNVGCKNVSDGVYEKNNSEVKKSGGGYKYDADGLYKKSNPEVKKGGYKYDFDDDFYEKNDSESVEKELARTKKELRETEKTLELLKLQLLSSKPLDGDRNLRSTRELIQQDKQVHKIGLHLVEKFGLTELQDLLKITCRKLNIDDVSLLIPGLDDVEKSIRLIPQMKDFITNVDRIVWHNGNNNQQLRSIPHKLTDTIKALNTFLNTKTSLRILENFVKAVQDVLEYTGDKKDLDSTLTHLKHHHNENEQLNESKNLVRHFRQIFSLGEGMDCLEKMKLLYRMESQVMVGIRGLEEALGIEKDKFPPGKLLLVAANRIMGDDYI